ncbi:DNA sulfur modification protein DndD [Anaerobacterium chartisolvens]|uniref:Nuclease SbcCD subunit C n=1 Tax=Anaerobacterium chartisolvens TaxID=1297424 RepID=A0A369ARX6_9FIRM|nr:DNA sulfur modification protein DndD [Anaerobacterium chartisolvens]RCX12102.1 DNA sulfur modification protein DndD [Anaerobacterium chartisolvens]
MLVNSIILKNFGIFYGEHTIDLASGDNKNIILIGGENGSGKTTILDAIRVALYGPLSLGYKTPNESYLNKIKERYYNSYAAKEPNSSSHAGIDINLTEEGVINNYKVMRIWNIKNSTIKEEYSVYKNGDELDKKDIFDFENYIRKFLPPALFNFFFFDGEKIAELFNTDEFDYSLKNSAMTMFNLDLFEILKGDLTNYIKQDNIFSSLTDEEKKFTNLSQEYDTLLEEVKSKKESILNLDNRISDNKQLIEKLEKEFRIHGGLLSKEHDSISNKIAFLEDDRKKVYDEQKGFYSDILPFVITKDLLIRVSEQLELEKDHNDYISIKQKLDHNTITTILKDFLLETKLINIENEKIIFNKLVNHLDVSIDKRLKPSVDNLNVIHNISTSEALDVQKFIDIINSYDSSFCEKSHAKVNQITTDIINLRKKQELNLKDNEFDKILNQIKLLNEEITKHEGHKQFILSEIINLENKLTLLQAQKDKVYNVIIRAKKDENIFDITQKINTVIDRFVNLVSVEKFREIEKHFIYMFSQLIRKSKFVVGAKINKDTFHLDIIDNTDNVIPKDNLSAGEKQIYILSMLWAILNSSKREAPLVFDTLLGRLDHCHKENIITKLLPQSGKQVIILSTNTEIDVSYYKKLKPHISKEYVISYDNNMKTVSIHKGYFFKEGEDNEF